MFSIGILSISYSQSDTSLIPNPYTGAAVKLAEDKQVPLDHLTVLDLQTLHPAFGEDVVEIWSYENRWVWGECFVCWVAYGVCGVYVYNVCVYVSVCHICIFGILHYGMHSVVCLYPSTVIIYMT
ncbi:hypothetical protein EON63_21365 [archaeon]|nr:MAG: hypothetical protein EON63_21365 [archaeon]